ncbi:hypothetical protein BDW42DRAFT_70511 [Aspergillus taichungensis]|uniref:Uncharacterized protein n=1 Tax=Aspergillus taichungensis TaxID=482145 RepID=A0A2J5HZT7_9EURO|nr:hypothetical protein BDW42DRAFT_70511 [Aspergillus taichungensis]
MLATRSWGNPPPKKEYGIYFSNHQPCGLDQYRTPNIPGKRRCGVCGCRESQKSRERSWTGSSNARGGFYFLLFVNYSHLGFLYYYYHYYYDYVTLLVSFVFPR